MMIIINGMLLANERLTTEIRINVNRHATDRQARKIEPLVSGPAWRIQ